MNVSTPRISIVVPCYNEFEMLEITIPRLTKFLQELISCNMIAPDSFLVLVDDGSIDGTWNRIITATQQSKSLIHGIRLALNSGHQNALLCGLDYVAHRCDAAISIDADLQDDLEVIPRMLEQFKDGQQLVYGVRASREVDSWFKRFTAVGFYRLMRFMGVDLVENHADFRLMSSSALINLQQFGEVNLFLRGLTNMLHQSTGVVYYNRAEREVGQTKYPLRKMLSLAWNGITSFSIVPLRFISVVGGLVFVFSIVMLFYALFGFMSGKVIPGWASIVIPLYLLGGLLMLSIGVLGEYIGKLFIEVKKRPRYLIDTVISDETKKNG